MIYSAGIPPVIVASPEFQTQNAELGEQAKKSFSMICNLIARETGQSVSTIAHFWKSALLITLARRAYENAQHWTRAHNTRFGPHPENLATHDCYDIDTAEQRVMIHSSGTPPVIGASPEFATQNAEFQDPEF